MIYKDYIEVNEEDTIFDVYSKLLNLQFKHFTGQQFSHWRNKSTKK